MSDRLQLVMVRRESPVTTVRMQKCSFDRLGPCVP